MKLQAQIEALENLAKLDATLTTLEAELLREGELLSDKKEQLKRLEERFEITRATVGDMDRTRGELLQDARQMSVQMERSREKLSRSRSAQASSPNVRIPRLRLASRGCVAVSRRQWSSS